MSMGWHVSTRVHGVTSQKPVTLMLWNMPEKETEGTEFFPLQVGTCSLYPGDCESFPLKTGIHFIKVLFTTTFTLPTQTLRSQTVSRSVQSPTFLIYIRYSHILPEFPSKLKITMFCDLTPCSLAKCTEVSYKDNSENSAHLYQCTWGHRPPSTSPRCDSPRLATSQLTWPRPSIADIYRPFAFISLFFSGLFAFFHSFFVPFFVFILSFVLSVFRSFFLSFVFSFFRSSFLSFFLSSTIELHSSPI